MIDESVVIKFQISTLQFKLACLGVVDELAKLTVIFEDRDKWYAINEGQWPDKFTLLNRFLRIGLRPPFIFND